MWFSAITDRGEGSPKNARQSKAPRGHPYPERRNNNNQTRTEIARNLALANNQTRTEIVSNLAPYSKIRSNNNQTRAKIVRNLVLAHLARKKIVRNSGRSRHGPDATISKTRAQRRFQVRGGSSQFSSGGA